MPDEGAIIGKVAVKVIPNTDSFKDNLKEQLEKIEEHYKKNPLDIRVEADGSKVKEQVEKIKEEAKKALAKAVTLKVNLDDQGSVEAGIARLKAELVKLGEQKIKVRLNKAGIEKELDKLEKRLKKVASITLSVNKKNQDSLKRAIDQIDAELEKLRERDINVKLNEKSLTKAKAKLEAALAKVATLDLRVDSNSLDSVKSAVKAIDAELAKMAEQEVRIKFDKQHLEHARQQYQKIIDDAAKKAQDEAEKALQASLKRSRLLVKEVNAAVEDIKFAPGVDKEKLAKSKREIEASLFKIRELEAKIAVEVDATKKRKMELEVEALKAEVAAIPIKLKTELDKEKAAKTKALLDALGKTRKVSFKPVINNRAFLGVAAALDRLSGYRDGRVFVDDLKDLLFNLDLSLPKLTKFALGIGGAGAAALAASSDLFAFSAALVEIVAGLGVALPGALMSAAVSGYVLYAAFKDFKKVLPDVTKKFAHLRDTISDSFWKQALVPIRTMVNRLFPQLEEGFSHLSSAMGKFFGKFSDAIAKQFGGGVLQKMFDNVAKGWEKLSEHANSFAVILRVLGTIGSEFFGFLLEALGNAADGWAKWLEEAEKTGKLKEMVNRAIRGLVALWRIGKNIFLIFSDIADAAERAIGADILVKWADGLTRVRNITKSPQFQKEMTGVFVAAREAMENIVNKAGPALEKAFTNLSHLVQQVFPDIGDTIGELLGGIADAFNNPRFLNGASSFFGTLRQFAEDLRPAWDSVGTAVGAVLELINTFIDTASPGVASAIENLSGWITTLAEALKPLVEGLGKALNDALDAVAPGITKVVDAIKRFAEGKGGQAMIGFFQDLVPLAKSVADWIGKAASAIADWANENLPKIREDLKPLLDDLKAFVDDHGDQIISVLTGIGDGLKWVVDQLSKLSPVAGELVTGLILFKLASGFTALGTAVRWLAWGVKSFPGIAVLTAIAGLVVAEAQPGVGSLELGLFGEGGWEGFKGRVGGVGTWIKDLFMGNLDWEQPIKDKYYEFGDWLKNLDWGGMAQDVWDGFVEGIQEAVGWDDIVDTFNTLVDGFKDFFGIHSPSTLFAEFGRNIIEGLLEGLGSLRDKVTEWFTSLGTWIKTTWNTLWTNVKNFFGGIVQNIKDAWNGGIEWIKSKYTAFKDWLTEKWNGAWDAIKSKFSGVVENIKTLWNNALEWVKTKFADAKTWLGAKVEEVKKFFTDLPGKIKGAFSNAKDFLKDAALNIMNGFLDWLGSKFQAVKDFFTSLTDLIPDWKGPVSRDKTLLKDAGVLIMDGFINGLESRYDAVKDSLGGLSNDVGAMAFDVPSAGLSGRLRGMAANSMAGDSGATRVLNYYAAPGSSLSAEEDLFAAGNRSRMGW